MFFGQPPKQLAQAWAIDLYSQIIILRMLGGQAYQHFSATATDLQMVGRIASKHGVEIERSILPFEAILSPEGSQRSALSGCDPAFSEHEAADSA